MTLKEELEFVEQEINNVKQHQNEKGFHNGTALSIIIRRYRDELKAYRTILVDDIADNIEKWPSYD